MIAGDIPFLKRVDASQGHNIGSMKSVRMELLVLKHLLHYMYIERQLILQFTQLSATSSMATCFGHPCDYHQAIYTKIVFI